MGAGASGWRAGAAVTLYVAASDWRQPAEMPANEGADRALRQAPGGDDRGMLIDVTRLVLRRLRGRLPTGVDRVGLAYLQHHGSGAHAVLAWRRWHAVLRMGDGQRLFAWLIAPAGAAAPARAAEWARMLLWCLRAVPARQLAGSLLLHTAHQGLEHASYAAGLRRAGVRTVVLVHDLIPLTHPEYGAHGEALRHQRRMDFVLRRACGVIANSHDTLQRLQAHAAAEGARLPPALVAPLAPALLAPPAPPTCQTPLRAPYFVVLGTIEPRKNHLLLLQLWRQMLQCAPAEAPHLVLIGRRGWECQETLHLLDRCPGLAARVHQRTHCSDAELAVWLAHARALLFPSFVEGYGLPVVEALARGLPVIASDLPVLRESAGDVPDYASPTDGARWLALIEDHARPDSARRAAQLQRMAGFRAPRWDTHHAGVEQWLATLGQERPALTFLLQPVQQSVPQPAPLPLPRIGAHLP